jgi:hypothetical protein
MTFKISKHYATQLVAKNDIEVFRPIDFENESNLFFVGKPSPYTDLIVADGEISSVNYSYRAPEPGYYRFIIPQGTKFYYTPYNSLMYVSKTIQLVSEDPLTDTDCIEICKFPKSYEEVCRTLHIQPLNEGKLIQYGLNGADIALKKLKLVCRLINIQYGINQYDWNVSELQKWSGYICPGLSHQFREAHSVELTSDTGCVNALYLPFPFAVKYVFNLNREFAEYLKLSWVGEDNIYASYPEACRNIGNMFYRYNSEID